MKFFSGDEEDAVTGRLCLMEGQPPVCLSASSAPCSLSIWEEMEKSKKKASYASIVERRENGPMAVETRFLIERVVHREHGS